MVVAVTSLISRGTVFSEGGTVGAWASVILFWLSVVGLLGISLKPSLDARREGGMLPLVQWCLGAVTLGAVLAGWTGLVLVSLLALVGVSLWRWRTKGPARRAESAP